MKIDLTCPVELWHFQMPTAQYPVLTLQMYNLSDKDVTDIQATFLGYDEKGAQLMRHVERVGELDGLSKHSFEMQLQLEGGEEAVDMELNIEKVWFEDGTVWRRGAFEPTEFEPNLLPRSRQLEVLRYIAGKDAVGYPSDQGAVWLCVCGRPNAAEDESCRRCRRDKHDIFTRFNEAAVEKIIIEKENELEEKAHKAREEAGKMAREREEKFKKRKRTRRVLVKTLCGVLLVAAAGYGVWFHGIPWYRYYTATQSLQSAQYDEAKAVFTELSETDYRDSADMAKECDYQKAASNMNAGTFTALKLAEDQFTALGDYRDSADKAQEACYIRAEKLMATSQYEDAIALYQNIASYKDAQDKILQCRYDMAMTYFDDLEFDKAKEIFLSLGAYQSSADYAVLCVYRPATLALENGEYARAAELYAQIPDYSDAAVKAQEANYKAGEQLFEDGQYEASAEYFLASGDYLDAFRKATQCLYQPAVIAMENGDYETARVSFEKIAGYEDSKQRAQECTYSLGMQKLTSADYEGAIALFDSIPDYEGAVNMRKEALYLLAQSQQQANEEDKALENYTALGDYKDAKDQASAIVYNRALVALNAGDYSTAMELYSGIIDYKDSADLLKDAKYQRAISLMDTDRAAAQILFEELGNYQNAEIYLEETRFAAANALMADGAYEDAAAIFDTLSIDGAAENYQECRYQQAAAATLAGDTMGASVYLKDILGYKDADELYRVSTYQSAVAARTAGNLSQAGTLFLSLGDYEDAAEQSTACFDAYYADAFETAKTAYAAKDYKTVIDTLNGFDFENLNATYASMPTMFKESCYQYADKLYNDKKPYEALVYYRMILDYRDVSTKKLDRVCYRMMGTWESTKGVVFVFNDDGTCVIDGRVLYYYAKNYSLETGSRADELSLTYNIVSSGEKTMTLRNNSSGTTYRLTRKDTGE